IGHRLVFVLQPSDDGWIIDVLPESEDSECVDYSRVLSSPLRGRNSNDLNTSYGVAARDALRLSREVAFVLHENDFSKAATLRQMLLWPYTYSDKEIEEAEAKYGISASGRASLRVLQSKISDSGELGKIEWIKFEVTVKFPSRSTAPPAPGRP